MGDIRLEAEDTVLGVGVACEDTMAIWWTEPFLINYLFQLKIVIHLSRGFKCSYFTSLVFK